MAARFQADWFDIDGTAFRITIFDDAYTGESVEQTLDGAVPGFELAYESDVDQPYQGIIASTCTFHLVNKGGAFDTWLQAIPNISGENDITIRLDELTPQGPRLEWAGIVMVDRIEMEDMPTPSQVQLIANDGTSFLKTVRTVPTGTTSGGATFLSSPNVITWLQTILQRIPTSAQWTSEGFLRAWSDLHPNNFGNADQTGGQGSAGLHILQQSNVTGALDPTTINVIDGTPEAYTDWTFLQSLCMLWNARLCLANGEWHFWPVNQHLMHSGGTSYAFLHNGYTKGATTPTSEDTATKQEFEERTTPQLGPITTAGRYVQMAGGTISHTIPLKSFRRSRPYRAQDFLNNSIRVGGAAAVNVSTAGLGLVDFDGPQSFFAGAKFNLSGTVSVARGAEAGQTFTPAGYAQMRLKANLDVGIYRYNWDSGQWVTDQSTDQFKYIGGLGFMVSGFDVNLDVNLNTAGLPQNSETLSLVVEADFQTVLGQALDFSGTNPQTAVQSFLATYLTNDAFEEQLIFQGESSRDQTETFDQGSLVFGTVDSLGSTSGNLTTSNQFQSGTVNWDMSTWTSHFSSTGEHINRLCVREAISLLQSGLPKREGQIRIPSGKRIPSPLMTIESEDGGTYFMVTRCSYSADERIADISRLQVSGLSLTGVTDNGTEGEPGSDGNDGSGSGDTGGATDDDGSGTVAVGGMPPVGLGAGTDSLFHQLSQITQNVVAAPDGVIRFKAKSGLLPINADIIDDATSTKKFVTQQLKDDLASLTSTLSSSQMKLKDTPSSNFVALASPSSVASDVTFKLPAADGSSGQVLQTDGSGNLSFATVSGGGGGGWHGSTTLIKVMPTEFMGNDVGRTIVQPRIEDDTVGKYGVATNNDSGLLIAVQEIPTGFKATHVEVHASSTVTGAVTIHEYDTTDGDITSKGSGNTNTSIDITDVSSSTSNALSITVAPGSSNVLVYSAHITITTI